MNFLEAQKELADTIKSASHRVKSYFWQLSGDGPNSLCIILGMELDELKIVLRLCKVYSGQNDNFLKNNFELLMSLCECDWTKCRLNGKVERFIRIGTEGVVVVPRDMFDQDGQLTC